MNKHNITEDTYFSKENAMKYVSASQIKAFQKCEACALAELKGEWEREKSTALTVGSYVDVCLTGTEEEIEKFKENHPEIYSSRGSTKGQLKSEFKKAQQMVDVVKADEKMMMSLSGKNQLILVGDLFGVPCKIKIDSMTKKAIFDLKTTADMHKSFYDENKGRSVSWVEYYQYPMQMAIYREIARQNGYGNLLCYLTVVDKTDVPDKDIFQIDSDTMDEELSNLKYVVKQIDAIKKGEIEPTRCGRCNYCKSTKKARILDWREILGELD